VGSRLYTVAFTVPAKTAIAAPASLPVALENNQLDQIRFIVPSGHIGTTGIRITSAGTQLVPFNAGGWITTDNDKFTWPYSAEVQQNALTLVAYNTDSHPHTFYVWFYISDLPAPAPVQISSPQAAGAAADASAALTGLSGAAGAGSGLPSDLGGSTPPPPVTPPPVFKTVTVPKAETLAALAKREKWTPAYLTEVEAMNGIIAGYNLKKGQKLNLPTK
jgi:LysM repeat protein